MAAEALINRVAGRTLVVDGMFWGAVLGILVASVPNFTRMGALTTRSDKPAVQFVVGMGMFVVISLVLIVLFWGLFSFLGQILPW